MIGNKSLIERAFDLAQDGTCASLLDIRNRLKREGFLLNEIEINLEGGLLKRQLNNFFLSRIPPAPLQEMTSKK